ncbi:hypothetical protein MMC18_008266 [Xylographa bjoerkii]|nr:hypothetical protein [Xylographa bjoerkii]
MEPMIDFYVCGLDSVKTVELLVLLRAGMRRSGVTSHLSWLWNKLIYANSTIETLSLAICQHLNPGSVPIKSSGNSEGERTARMTSLVKKYTEGLPSTDTIAQWKIDIKLDDSKVQFFSGDLRLSHSGFSNAESDSHFLQLDFVIHNAWTVDFNHSLESFEQVHFRGLRNIIDFSLSRAQKPHLFFISFIASVSRWSAIHGTAIPVPEDPISSSSLAANIGYAESKNHPAYGNIAGPLDLSHGVWNEREWFPSLLKTSKAISKLPDHIPAVDYIPVDLLSDIIMQIVLRSLATGTQNVYNIVSPHQTKWSELLESIRKAIGNECQIVSAVEWIKAVEVDGHEGEDVATVTLKPTLKILEFTKDTLSAEAQVYETSNGKAASETFAGLGLVTKEWMQVWLRQLGY